MQRVWVIIVCSSSTRPSQSSASLSPSPKRLTKTNITSVTLFPTLLSDPVVPQLAVQVPFLTFASASVLEPSAPLTTSPSLALVLATDELALAFLVVVVGVLSVSATVVVMATTGVLVFPLLVHFLFHLDF